jgi:hypothetical protein
MERGGERRMERRWSVGSEDGWVGKSACQDFAPLPRRHSLYQVPNASSSTTRISTSHSGLQTIYFEIEVKGKKIKVLREGCRWLAVRGTSWGKGRGVSERPSITVQLVSIIPTFQPTVHLAQQFIQDLASGIEMFFCFWGHRFDRSRPLILLTECTML